MECLFLHATIQCPITEIWVFARLLQTELCFDMVAHMALKTTGFAISCYVQVCEK